MITVNIPIPDTCSKCPMSCQIPRPNYSNGHIDYTILCCVDFQEHTVMDETCVIKGEIKE